MEIFLELENIVDKAVSLVESQGIKKGKGMMSYFLDILNCK